MSVHVLSGVSRIAGQAAQGLMGAWAISYAVQQASGLAYWMRDPDHIEKHLVSYIKGFSVAEAAPVNQLVIELKFGRNRERVITDLKRVSKPGLRVYAGKDRLPRVLGGMGTAIISTSKGLVTSRVAESEGIGGEVIAFVW